MFSHVPLPLAVADVTPTSDCNPVANRVGIRRALTDCAVDNAARLTRCPALAFDSGVVAIEVGDGCGCARPANRRLGLRVIAGAHCCGGKAKRQARNRNCGGDRSYP